MEPLQGMVKTSRPKTLDDAIRAAYDLEPTTTTLKGAQLHKRHVMKKFAAEKEVTSKPKTFFPPRTNQLDATTRKKLREKSKCFHCKKLWEPGHSCQGKGQVHYIEVLPHDDDDSDLEVHDDVLEHEETPKEEASLGSMISSLNGAPKYFTLKVIGQAGGQEVMVLIDPDATHNCIDKNFVSKKGIKTKSFEGFRVSNANGKLTLVDQVVEKFGVRLHNYTARENFCVYPLDGHPHMILGVQWLFELGDIHTNYKNLTMSFQVLIRNQGRLSSNDKQKDGSNLAAQ